MKLILPDKKLLKQTSDVDYFHWNYSFPIKYVQKFRFKAILRLMGDNKYENLLEIGTGSGIFLPELSMHCNNLFAIDVHENMKAVEEMCNRMNINAKLKRSSIEDTDFPDNFFDVIIGVSVLEFVPNLDIAINEIRRILKNTGYFITICPFQSTLLDFILSFYSRRKPDEEFGDARLKVAETLEKRFKIKKKRIYPILIGKIFPIYAYYKLLK